MPIERIDVPRAHELLRSEPGAVYIDVRTEEEFAAGHPDGAINIPIGFRNPRLQRLEPNPDFLSVVRACVPPSTPVVVGCAVGPRAEMAAGLMVENGYSTVRWVIGGFNGMADGAGNVIAPGWRQLGLPESRSTGDGVSYASLRKRIPQ